MKKIIVTGRVGKDPEKRTTNGGSTFASFSLAVSSGTKANPKTDWLDVSVSSEKMVEVVMNYVKKGSQLLIEGSPAVNAYINKENKAVGNLIIYANTIEFIGGKKEENTEGGGGTNTAGKPLQSDHVPF